MYIFGYRAELVPMSGVASDTGNMSPTMVAKIVIDNIIVTSQGQIKLIDLGFGTNLMADGSGYAKTRIGSPASLSPEIIAGEPYQP